jgi:hypothetical protein
MRCVYSKVGEVVHRSNRITIRTKTAWGALGSGAKTLTGRRPSLGANERRLARTPSVPTSGIPRAEERPYPVTANI